MIFDMKEGMPHFPEQTPSEAEKVVEKIPTPEEVLEVFSNLIGADKESKEERRKIDAEGNLYLLEVTTPGEKEGEVIEYAYMRKGRHAEGGITETNIHLTYYEDQMPVGGKLAARFINNAWEIIS